MAVAGLSFEELGFSSPSLFVPLFLTAFGFLSPVLLDLSLLLLFLPAILDSVEYVRNMIYGKSRFFFLVKSVTMARLGGGQHD